MATTDAKAGFRLPWSSDRPATDPVVESAIAEVDAPTDDTSDSDWPSADVAASDAGATTADPTAAGAAPSPASTRGVPAAPAPARKPSRFLADMTKAMQAAAEDARTRSLTQLQADAKTHIESIHGRSSNEAANLRKAADDDVAAVREWSKAEIARIREETDTRIADRKSQLEREIEGHAAVIEREIEAVQATVATFEAEMAAFFERLLAEEDPTHFATLFENLPEPPALDDVVVAAAAAPAPVDEPVAVAEPDVAPEAEVITPIEAPAAEPTLEAEPVAVDVIADGGTAEAQTAGELEVPDADPAPGEDPRFTALGLSPDFDAAEAEAEAFADAGTGEDEEIEIPVIGDDALAARLAGLMPDVQGAAETVTTQVVVVGLISVASIASFKRHLGRLPGVSSVGVSSGPEGEFVFAVGHAPDVALRDVIPSLPTFQARVTGSADGAVHVTAHDPESDA